MKDQFPIFKSQPQKEPKRSQRTLFLILFIMTSAIIGFFFLPQILGFIDVNVYHPEPEIPPEAYVTPPDDDGPGRIIRGFDPIPEEDLEIYINEKGEQIVDAKANGYRLTLDPSIDVGVNPTSPTSVSLYETALKKEDEYWCDAIINTYWFDEETPSIDSFIKNRVDELVHYDLVENTITRISDPERELYRWRFKLERFMNKPDSLILVDGDRFHTIGQANYDNPDCMQAEDILELMDYE